MADRRLFRRRTDRMIAGVAGGLADFFGISATKVRVAFAVFGLFGAGELVYLILWIVVPKEPVPPPAP